MKPNGSYTMLGRDWRNMIEMDKQLNSLIDMVKIN